MPRVLPLFILLLITLSGYSQCFQQPVSIQARASEADVIAEGRIDSSYYVWNSNHNLILTVHRFNVYKYFKGTSTNQNLEIITLGGKLDGELHSVEPELHPEKGTTGIFFLKNNTQQMSSTAGGNTYIPVAAEQGLIEYDLISKSAFGPFEKYLNISSVLYPALTAVTGKNYSAINSFNINSKVLLRTSATPTITSFAPNPITAGTGSVLTINGTNFGATYSGSANVEFKNADNGGAGFISTSAANIISWSDVQIKVKVPTKAGTGTIRITNATAESVTSGSNLTVTYSQLNATSGGTDYEPNLINKNAVGGYTYTYSTATANNGVSFDGHANAKSHFATALNNWNCNTGFNVIISGSNTPIGAPANDATSVAMFDNDGSPLPAGVLGRATSFFSSCDGINWSVSDIDIVFKRDGTDGITWYFGVPGSQPAGTSDFESVALHELGHNHQLAHVISPGAVMNFSITTGTNNRNLNPAQDIAAGLYIMGHSNTFAQCGKTGMTNFSCTLPPVTNFSATPLSSCNVPETINFTDLSTNAPTSWSWTFTGGTPATSTSQNPSIVYNASGTYNVSLTATNANGSNAITKTGYISVGGSAVPLTETFEGTFLPSGYSIINPDAGVLTGLTWQQTGSITGPSGAATKAAFINYYNYNFDIGTTDDLITLKYDLTGSTSSQLAFDLAYERYDAADYERLQIFLSTDCGVTFPNQIYNKSGSDADAGANDLRTKSETGVEFFPSSSTHWRHETINLTSYVGSVIILKFRGTNGFGNNLFIDNINVTGNALAVIFESFNAMKSGPVVSLSWKTNENSENEVYKIERSSDGINFSEILSVASEKGKQLYNATDYGPGNEMVYYRLRQAQENSGLNNYSTIVAVDMTGKLSSNDLIIFPNPVSTGEIFSFESQDQRMGDLRLFDLTGKAVDHVSFTKRGSFIEVSSNLNSGVYIVEYRSENLIRKGKIMVK